MPPTSTDKQTGALLDALARVLAPLVRLLIARGVTFQMASELLKRVYVQAAQRHFSADDAATGTRLSLLTGLNRKEIRRLTSDAADDKRPEDMTSFASAAHDLWCSGRRWRDRDGNPKPLPRHTSGRQASFDDLVRSITLDHRPSAVLAELLRLGYATEDDDGFVHVNPQAFLPQRGLEDRLQALGENLEDHARAATVNVLSKQPPFLERSVFSDELSAGSVEALARLAQGQWQRVHDETIRQAIAAEADDARAGRPGNMRMRVGMYFYAEEKKDEQ